MARSKSAARVEEAIAEVVALRAASDGEPKRRALIAALAHSSARVVHAAASLLEESDSKGAWPELAAAFARLLDAGEPAKTDPTCRAKLGLLRAMLHLEAEDERAAYLRGRRYVQNEPVWGGAVDTAGEVRGLCVLGLVRSRHPEAAVYAAECLADPERAARIGAAHALAEAAPDSALPVLRHKLAIGDDDPEVVGACFAAFFELAPGFGLELARELLRTAAAPDAESIALALGESRKREALPVLRDFAMQADDVSRPVAFVAMTLLRDDEATTHLVGVVREGPARHADQALKALSHFRHDPKLCERVLQAARARKDRNVTATARELFES